MKFEDAVNTLKVWEDFGLRNVRFSGGEPTIYPKLVDLVSFSKYLGTERIALSTNGSASKYLYESLLRAGVNDFSISLDACCSSAGDEISGVPGSWEKVASNIKWISERAYTTVGVVFTESTVQTVGDIIEFAYSLGVSDIRIIPAAQIGNKKCFLNISEEIVNKYPILKYRIGNLKEGKPFRGLSDSDSHRCGLVLDDMVISHGKHYPCVIYMREYGKNIGHINKHMRADRFLWYANHDTHEDAICKNNCLDVCVEYNNKYENFHSRIQ